MGRGQHTPPLSSQGARRAARHVGLALALALPLALGGSEVHLAQGSRGLWRGMLAAPTPARLALALAAGALGAWALRHLPAHATRPLLALALAGAPLVPLLSGWGWPLVAFQGPAFTLLAAAALALSAARIWRLARVHRTARALPAPDSWRRELLLVLVAWAFFTWLGRYLPGPAGPQGDEPHYLLLAHSLWHDGDVDLADEFDTRAYRAFFGGELGAHTSPASPPGVLYSVHTPGLGALLLPAYAWGGYPAAKAWMALLAALTAAGLYRLVREVAGDERAALFAWVVAVCVPPLPLYALAIYPETPAALAAVTLLLLARRPLQTWRALAAALAAAVLPWLHPKFLPLALVGLGLVLLRRSAHGRAAWPAHLGAVAVFAASLAGLLACFHALYGRAALDAAYGPRLASDLGFERLPRGLLGLFLDRQFGLALLAPVWLLALPGLRALWSGQGHAPQPAGLETASEAWLPARRGDVLRAVAGAGAVLGVGAAFSMWWGGACPPGRFVVPALPALALGVAAGWKLRRDAGWALLAWSAALLLLAAESPRALHNRADGQSGFLQFLAPALDLDGSLPSFVVGGAEAPLLALTLLAAAALAWARGLRGLCAGALAYLALAGALRTSPLLDARGAVLRLLNAWDESLLVGVAGPLDPQQLSLPLDLPQAPWLLRQGDERRSRRVALPPGLYQVEFDATPGARRDAVHLARFELRQDELALDWTFLRVDRPLVPLRLLLPAGAPRLVLVASGVADETRLEGVRLRPLALVPSGRREGYAFPVVRDEERYRAGDARLRVSVLDRSVPDLGGYRLAGEWGRFLVEGAPGDRLRVRLRRTGAPPSPAGLWWDERALVFPAGTEAVLELAHDTGTRLGDIQVTPLRLHVAGGAWVAFEAPP